MSESSIRYYNLLFILCHHHQKMRKFFDATTIRNIMSRSLITDSPYKKRYVLWMAFLANCSPEDIFGNFTMYAIINVSLNIIWNMSRSLIIDSPYKKRYVLWMTFSANCSPEDIFHKFTIYVIINVSLNTIRNILMSRSLITDSPFKKQYVLWMTFLANALWKVFSINSTCIP